MTSRSLCSKLVRDEARRNLWAVILSVVGFFFAAPLNVLIRIQQKLALRELPFYTEEHIQSMLQSNLNDFLNGKNNLVCVGLMIMAALCGIALFRYLHDRRQVDFYHALPIRREQLFAVKYGAGVLLVLPAYFVMRLVAVLIVAGAGYAHIIHITQMILAIVTELTAFFSVYSISVLCTILTGNTIISIVLDFWALFSVLVVYWVGGLYAGEFYDTFVGSWIACMPVSPVGAFLAVYGWDAPTVLKYLLVAVLALALSVYLFRIRKSERAGAAIAFPLIKLPLKIYVCLVMSAVTGYFFLSVADEFWMWFGLVAGVVLIHWLMEIIYHFDFHAIFRHVPTMLVLVVVSVVGMIGVKNDVFGYDRWIPNTEEVASARIYNLSRSTDGSHAYDRYYGGEVDNVFSPDAIAAMCELTERAVGELETGTRFDEIGEGYSYYAVFHMKNGKEVERRYSVWYSDETYELINRVIYTPEYRKATSGAYLFDPEDQEMILKVYDVLSEKGAVILRDQEQVEELFAAMREDVLTLTAEEAETAAPVMEIRLGTQGQYNSEWDDDWCYSVFVYPSFTKTLALAEQYTGITPSELTADRVQNMVVYDYRYRSGNEDNIQTVGNREDIEALLENAVISDGAGFGMPLSDDVLLQVMLTDGSYVELRYRFDKIPEELLTELFGAPLAE